MPMPLPMSGDPVRMNPFYTPTKRILEVLNRRKWVACYSGGKDSTSLVMYLEWLRRAKLLTVEKPRLVLSDTGTEYPFLAAVSDRMIETLRACGWDCEIVRPKRIKKLYVSIFGRGLIPPLLGTKGMRWCTSQTKVQPMKDFIKTLGEDWLPLSGMRWNESPQRDKKLREFGGCKSGGECGLQQLDSGGVTFKPIESWYTHEVIAWLAGGMAVAGLPADVVPRGVSDMLADLLPISQELVRVYEPTFSSKGFGLKAQKVNTLRFGCVACPALVSDKVLRKKAAKNPKMTLVNRIYVIWTEVRKQYNRLWRMDEKDGKPYRKIGPIKLAVRKKYFEEVLELQKQSGVMIVPPKDEALVRKLWKSGNCYTRSWDKSMDDTWEE